MNDYQRLLNSTEVYLQALKNIGLLYVNVRPETLQRLARPVEKASSPRFNAQSFSAPSAVVRAPSTPPPLAPREADLLPANGNPVPSAPLSREEKANATAALRERALACVKCPHLAASRRNVVFGVGDIHFPLMFVGEAPGADEDAQGEPFVGAAGQLLTKIIQTMGFSRQTVYIANILKCRPDTPGQSAGNRKPTPDEMKTCLP